MGWQDAPVVGSGQAWASAPEIEKDAKPSKAELWKRELYTSAPGALVRGVKDVLDTGAEFLASGFDRLTGTKEGERLRSQNEAGKADFAENTKGSIVAPVFRVVGNVAGTAPVVSAMGAGAGAVGLNRLGNAIASGGMSLGAPGGNALLNLITRAAGGGASGYATAGLVDPQDATTGGVIGAVLPGAAKVAGATGNAIGSLLRADPNLKPLAQTAVNKYGIPLSASDVTGNRLTKATRSVLDDSLGIGYRGAQQNEAKQAAFNRAVGSTFGAEGDRLTPEVIDAAKSRMGSEFDRLWNKNALQVDPQLVNSLEALRTNANKLPAGESNRLLSEIDDLFAKMQPNANGELFIPGDVANRFQSYLGRQVNSAQSFLKDDLGNLRQALISAFNRNISPEDVAALAKTRSQYKAFKTVEPLLTGAEVGVAGRTAGDVPASMLPNAVRKSYSDPTGQPLTELSQIGSQFLVPRVAQTGGSPRALIQNTMIGGALGAGAFTNPASLLAIPAAAGVNELLSNPTIGRLLLSDPAAKNELLRLLSSPEASGALMRSATASSAQ